MIRRFSAWLSVVATSVLLSVGSTQADSIRVSQWVSVGDVSLYTEIRAEQSEAPLLLWLHGGPGGAERPLFRYFNSDLEKHFIVVYFDQRGAGNSYDANADTQKLTISQHLSDLDRVVDYLLARFDRRAINLLGHSWGGTLGLFYAQAHPSKISALIAIAPSIAVKEQWKREYDWDLSVATAKNDGLALDKLRNIGRPPFGSSRQVLDLQTVTQSFGGVEFAHHNHLAIAAYGIVTGLVTPNEIFRIIRGNEQSLTAMHAEMAGLDLREAIHSINAPVAFFLGRHDHHVDSLLSAGYFEALQAPRKFLCWFERSAHDVPFDEPSELVNRVITVVKSVSISTGE